MFEISYIFQIDSFDAAKAYCDKFRAIKPAVYTSRCNAARLERDQRLVENNDENSDSDMDTQEAHVDTVEPTNKSSQEASTSDDNKIPLATVVLDEQEADIFDDILEDNDIDDSIVSDSPIEIITFSPGGTKRATKKFGDDCQMTYPVDQNAFEPKPAGYQMKSNDVLSANMPFKENVGVFFVVIHFMHK